MAKNRKTPDMNLPIWFDGQNINEALFCEEFLRERRIIFANGAFFTPDGRVTDDLPLRGEIYEKLKFCAVNNIPRKITNILEVLKLEAQVPDFTPEQDRIHVFNGTLLLEGTFAEGRPAIVRSRLPVAYNPNAPAPVIWLNFLDDLLYPEDIPTFQEFIGYCLIPSNKGQRMMVIKGNGGEGKSQIGAVLGSIFGTNMKDGSIGKISENRFARADLEHILLCVDAWRNSNSAITMLWWDIDNCVKETVKKRITTQTHGIRFEYESGFLFIILPSGRKLAYVKPKMGVNQFGGESVTYEGVGGTKKWERLESYGPKFCENITQAIARDVLMYAMQTLRCCRIVAHTLMFYIFSKSSLDRVLY